MIWNLLKKHLFDCTKKEAVLLAGLLLLLIGYLLFSSFRGWNTEEPAQVLTVGSENERMKRIADLIEQRTETEVKLNEKIEVGSDSVLDVMDDLLRKRSH